MRRLHPAFTRPECRAMMLAYADLLDWRIRAAREYQRFGFNATLMDNIVHHHIFLWSATTGTRQQNLVDQLQAPRRTIRDSLNRLEAAEMICRDGRTYYAANRTADFAEAITPEFLAILGRLADAVIACREVSRRKTP